jgi:hypothetical protein
MKLLPAVLIGTLAGIVPALAQTSTTSTTTAPDGRTTTNWSDGSSATTRTDGSTTTTTYQPPGSGYQYQAMGGSSGYNPLGPGGKNPTGHKSEGGEEVLGNFGTGKTGSTDKPTEAEVAKAKHDQHVCAPVKVYLDTGVVYQRADGCG